MSAPSPISLAVLNLGGGEIILILVLLFILGALALGFLAVIFFIVRAVMKKPSAPPMPLPPEALQYEERRDRDHLRLLAIFHFVFAGFAFVGTIFLAIHYMVMHTVFANPEMWKSPQPMPPKVFLDAFVWFYLFMGIAVVAVLILNVLSGIFLLQKKYRTFSFVVAGLNCLQMPFGTVLGIFTIVVLSRAV